MDPKLLEYIKISVFPKYKRFYSHGIVHIAKVIETSQKLAEEYRLDPNMCYTMAAYHDLGLSIDRDNHEIESGKIFANDQTVQHFFDRAQSKIIKEAIEDHRGSRKIPPRNLYGKVLSDADRDFDIKILTHQQLGTSIKNYPDLTNFEEHFERCYTYILARRGVSGHFNLWTSSPFLIQQRAQFEKDFLNKVYARTVYRAEFDQICSDGTLAKIKNYYLDY